MSEAPEFQHTSDVNLNDAEIGRLVAWIFDETMSTLDRRSMQRLVSSLLARLAVYELKQTPLNDVVQFNYSNPRRVLTPTIGFGTPEELELALALLQEELDELTVAVAEDNFVGAVDALVDLEYVLLNAVAAHGLHSRAGLWEALFKEVHKSNMSKFIEGVPKFREDGKLLKGPDYKAPNLEDILRRYGWNGE
jgi:hypothetical protein